MKEEQSGSTSTPCSTPFLRGHNARPPGLRACPCPTPFDPQGHEALPVHRLGPPGDGATGFHLAGEKSGLQIAAAQQTRACRGGGAAPPRRSRASRGPACRVQRGLPGGQSSPPLCCMGRPEPFLRVLPLQKPRRGRGSYQLKDVRRTPWPSGALSPRPLGICVRRPLC